MKNITVEKIELIQKLKENRAEHRQIFEEALDGWHKKVLDELERQLALARDNKVENVYVSIPRPEDHTTDYDRRIEMYEMAIEVEIELTEQEFAMYVQDDWGWQQQFLTSNKMYTDTAAAKLDRMS